MAEQTITTTYKIPRKKIEQYLEQTFSNKIPDGFQLLEFTVINGAKFHHVDKDNDKKRLDAWSTITAQEIIDMVNQIMDKNFVVAQLHDFTVGNDTSFFEVTIL